jgi:PAS domain S-box-containing protein
VHPLAEAPIGYVELDHELRCVYANGALAAWVGRESGDVHGRRLAEIVGARAADVLELEARAALGGARPVGWVRVDEPGGRRLSAAIVPVHDGDGVVARVGVVVDEVLRWVVPRGTNLLGVVLAGADGTVIDANEAYLQIIGCTRDDVRAGRVRWRPPGPTGPTGSFTPVETEHVRADGGRVRVLVGGGRPGSGDPVVGYAIDVTERRRAEDELRRSQMDLAEVQRLAQVGSWRYEADSHTNRWSAELRRMFGLPPGDEPLGAQTALDVIHPDDREALLRTTREALRPGGTMEMSFRGFGPGGELRHLRAVGEAIVEDGRVVRLRGTTQDVTAERRAAEALRASEARFRALVEDLSVGVVVYGPAGEIRLANRAALELLGDPPDQAGVRDDGTEVADDDRPVARAIATAKPVRDVVVGMKRPGQRERVWLLVTAVPELDDSGAVKQVICTCSDITERRRAQTRIALADRLASVGTLAAGVAHEINNPLSYVIANLAFIADEISSHPALEGLADVVAEAQEGAARVRDVVRDLRTFARGDENRRGAADVRRVVESAVSIVWSQIRHSARLVVDVGALPPVQASESRLGQVLVNLLANAAQAIRPGAADANEIRVAGHIDSTGRVVIEVSDTGCGIPADDLNRVFDPFFTTKPIGVGTGLGLSVCQGIVAELQGEIAVESTVGKGSTFRVALPAVVPDDSAPPSPRLAPLPGRTRARVLIVDDEPAIGASIARLLGERHDFLALTSGVEALERIGRAPGAFDVLLCDVLMPELSGIRLHERLIELAPELARRTIFLTGGGFTAETSDFLARTEHPVLEKPFEPDRLLALIDAALRRRERA